MCQKSKKVGVECGAKCDFVTGVPRPKLLLSPGCPQLPEIQTTKVNVLREHVRVLTVEGFSSEKSWQESWQESWHDSALLNAICENRGTNRVNFLVISFWWFGVNGFSSP